jgi:flagellar biosynthesis GTPase FlhF
MSSDYKQLFEQIRAASGTINAAASAATEQIEEFEKNLLEAEPGVSVWTAPILDEEGEFTDEAGDSARARRVVELGLAKVKKWGIAVREQYFSIEDGSLVGHEVKLLRKADRTLRVLCAPHLGVLLDAVHSELALLAARVDAIDAAAKEAKAARDAEKAAAKEAKEAEKAAAKEAEKAEKAAAKEAKEAKEAEKGAEKAAAKEAKGAEKAAAKEAKRAAEPGSVVSEQSL